MKIRALLIIGICTCYFSLFAEKLTWVDSMDTYARTKFLPAKKYHWNWQSAALLNVMKVQYENSTDDNRNVYLRYIEKAMKKTRGVANGRKPNAVASALGLAFLARETGESWCRELADKVYDDYKNIPRAANGGVTHKNKYKELWDDTIFMIGGFLREMYLLTGNEEYIDELLFQVEAHREKLRDEQWGLWYHGWDGDTKNRINFCGQTGWSNNPTKTSTEIWGRGNGWVVVTLAETVLALPKDHPKREKFAVYLKEMIEQLPELQDSISGHWFQLPVRTYEEGNYIESSCTAMFGYGLLVGLKIGIVSGEAYETAVEKAFYGLRKHSIKSVGNSFLSTKNVCKGTCIGDKEYYFNRKAASEKSFGLGMFILFGRGYLYSKSMLE